MIIAVNPGHDVNLDSGACGRYLREADVTENVAEMVIDGLRKLGHDAQYVQSNELSEICSQADALDADIFVSIHCNAAENTAAQGTETFYYSDQPSMQLADCIQQNVVEMLGTEDRGTKNGNWLAVLNGTNIAATVLVELAFISNEDEENMLATRQQDCADAIIAGIAQYITEMGLVEND